MIRVSKKLGKRNTTNFEDLCLGHFVLANSHVSSDTGYLIQKSTMSVEGVRRGGTKYTVQQQTQIRRSPVSCSIHQYINFNFNIISLTLVQSANLPITSQIATEIDSKDPQHRLPNTIGNLLNVMDLNAFPHDRYHIAL